MRTPLRTLTLIMLVLALSLGARATFADEYGDYGLYVELEGEMSDGRSLVTRYAHCSQIYVAEGQTVRAGDVIGAVGDSGSSTGTHLHLEVIVDGDYLDPLFFVDTGDSTEQRLP